MFRAINIRLVRYIQNASSQPDVIFVIKQAIAEINRQLCEAFRLRDAGLHVAHCTDDVRLLSSGYPIVTGKQAVRDSWQDAMNIGARNLRFRIMSLETILDSAIEIGAFTLLWGSEREQGKEEIGKYVVIWKYQADQSWKLAVGIFNSDSPNAS